MPVRFLSTCALMLVWGCGPGTQSFPLDPAPADAKASFVALQACAKHLGHRASVSDTGVRVDTTPERRVEFVLGPDDKLTMMTWVATDSDRGHLTKLKVLGEALWECATSQPPPLPSASAAASSAPPPAPPPPAPTPPPPPTPRVAPSAAPSAAPSVSSAPKSCDEDDTCRRPSGASCEANEDCNSDVCEQGTCR